MTEISCNCIICAGEFNLAELHNVVLSQINVTNFKVCEACFNICDPAEDYRQVRDIVSSYTKFSEARNLFDEAQNILNSIKN